MTLRFSHRNHPLSCMWDTIDVPVVVVELYSKWYDLYLLHTDGSVSTIPPDVLEANSKADETTFCDHTFNPTVVERMAEKNGWIVHDLTMELLIGRWERECKENYL